MIIEELKVIEVVLLRHGQSTWNLENRFTGWTDVDLSSHGEQEAREAGRLLKNHGFHFDRIFTSVLKRAIRTAWLAQHEMDACWTPTVMDWRLNERHYGALQGLNKSETQQRHGAEQVHLWRRGYAIRPPSLESGDTRHPRFDHRYNALDPALLPATESLEDTVNRVLPYWRETIIPCLRRDETVLIVAHGNSLRGLIKHLDAISDEDIMELDLPTGIPLVYEFDEGLVTRNRYYLADPPQHSATAGDGSHRSTAAVDV
jgi:2,3-bisphosphoglycerate-dependent phosphoglycerate mutase